MNGFIDNIHLAGRDIPVRYVAQLTAKDGDRVDGLWEPYEGSGGVIYIDAELGLQSGVEALWHEVMHAVETVAGLELGEQTVQTIAAFLCQLGAKLPGQIL